MTKRTILKVSNDWIATFKHRLEQKKGWGDHPTDYEKEAFYIILNLLERVK